MSKGELPVPHIIAIVLGIIVLGLLAYLVYANFIKVGGTISEETCKSKFTQYCTLWSILGYEKKPIGYETGFYEANPECDKSKFKDEPDGCRVFLNQPTSTTTTIKR